MCATGVHFYLMFMPSSMKSSIVLCYNINKLTYTHTYTHTRLTALCPRLPRWDGTTKVKPIWILLEQDTVSGSGISWAICKSAPRSRQIARPAPQYSDALPAAQPTVLKHWRHIINLLSFLHNWNQTSVAYPPTGSRPKEEMSTQPTLFVGYDTHLPSAFLEGASDK